MHCKVEKIGVDPISISPDGPIMILGSDELVFRFLRIFPKNRVGFNTMQIWDF